MTSNKFVSKHFFHHESLMSNIEEELEADSECIIEYCKIQSP